MLKYYPVMEFYSVSSLALRANWAELFDQIPSSVAYSVNRIKLVALGRSCVFTNGLWQVRLVHQRC